MTYWLPGATVVDLHPNIGNGPFGSFLGVILHVNVDEAGTPDSFWGDGNPGQVCPNFQVYKDGSIHQMLPLDWQPWCQIDGNFNYAAIETAGLPSEPLTAAQVASVGRIVAAYHSQLGMPLTLADSPGQRGLGTHAMGGPAWGGHPCPGTIRAGQRTAILAAASGLPTGELTMDAEATAAFAALNNRLTALFAVDTTGDGKPDVTGTVQGADRYALADVLASVQATQQMVAALPARLASLQAAVAALSPTLAKVQSAVAAIKPGEVVLDTAAIVTGVVGGVASKIQGFTFRAQP